MRGSMRVRGWASRGGATALWYKRSLGSSEIGDRLCCSTCFAWSSETFSLRSAEHRADMGRGMLSTLQLGLLLLALHLLQQVFSQVSTPSPAGAGTTFRASTTKGGVSALQSTVNVLLLSLALLFQLYSWESQAENSSNSSFQTQIKRLLDVQCGKEDNSSSSSLLIPLHILLTDNVENIKFEWFEDHLKNVTRYEICRILCTRLKGKPVAKISKWSDVINWVLRNMDS